MGILALLLFLSLLCILLNIPGRRCRTGKLEKLFRIFVGRSAFQQSRALQWDSKARTPSDPQ